MKGYPTLKWMPKGKSAPGDAETVNAPRSADGLGKWITEKTGVKATKPAEVCLVQGARWNICVRTANRSFLQRAEQGQETQPAKGSQGKKNLASKV